LTPSRAPVIVIAAVQFGVSHLPLRRSSVSQRFELIVGAMSAAMIAGETASSRKIHRLGSEPVVRRRPRRADARGAKPKIHTGGNQRGSKREQKASKC